MNKMMMERLRDGCLNLMSEVLPEQFVKVEQGVSSLSYQQHSVSTEVTLRWDGDYSLSLSNNCVDKLILTTYAEDGLTTFLVGHAGDEFLWSFRGFDEIRGIAPSEFKKLGSKIDLRHPPPFPRLNQAIEAYRRKVWIDMDVGHLKDTSHVEKFIYDLISSLPLYSKEKDLIKTFANLHMKENPDVVYNETNAAGLIPSFRRWRSNNQG